MGDVVTMRRKPDQKEGSARVGMIVFVSAWGMMFVTLLLTYVFVRAQAEAWPPPNIPALPTGIPLASTLLLLGASGLVELGRRAIRRNGAGTLWRSWSGAAVLGLGFVLLQGWLFLLLRGLGLKGSFGALFLMYLLFHGVSVLAGLPGLGVVAARARAGRYGALQHVGVGLWALYWHFVTAAWVLLYVGVYWI